MTTLTSDEREAMKTTSLAAAPTAKPRLRRGPAAMARLRQELLERARRIYGSEGAAGLSTMALYSYFPSKQALLERLWLEVFEALLAELLAASARRRAPLKVMEAHLRAFLAFWEARPDQFRLIYMSTQPQAGEGQLPIQEQPVYQQLIQLKRERVAACASGAARPSEALLAESATLALAKLLGYLLLVLGMPRYPLPERARLRERVVADALQGIAGSPAG
jgi:AcrR family transcriptional regulator